MRYTLRTLLIALAVGPLLLISQSRAPSPKKPSAILGKWKIVAVESEGTIDRDNEDEVVWEFRDNEILWTHPDKKVVRGKCSYDLQSKPMRIAYSGLPKEPGIPKELGDDYCARGIFRIDGGGLQLCVTIQLLDERPEYPSKFDTAEYDEFTKMVLFSKITDE